MRILLIAGGWSPERAVSLSGARGIREALVSLGHEVLDCDPVRDLKQLQAMARSVDAAFINLHGAGGEDGLIQTLLEAAGCPYQGTGPAGSFLALHKAAAKTVYEANGLPTPAWEFHPTPPEGFEEGTWSPELSFPVFVKAATGGSSLDMGRAEDAPACRAVMAELYAKGLEPLLETAAPGQEVTCAVLGADGAEQTLPPILIVPHGAAFFDYENKYAADGAEEICPAPIAAEPYAEVQRLALTAHRALGLSGYSRTDCILAADGSLTILETNTLPGMTPTSLVPRAAKAAGIAFPQLIQRLLELALARSGKPDA